MKSEASASSATSPTEMGGHARPQPASPASPRSPAIAEVTTPVARVRRMLGISKPMRRVTASRVAVKKVLKSASSENQLKASPEGWMISKTPTSPATVAAQWRQPTLSRRKSMASPVRISGPASVIAVPFASGSPMSDTTQQKEALASITPRPPAQIVRWTVRKRNACGCVAARPTRMKTTTQAPRVKMI